MGDFWQDRSFIDPHGVYGKVVRVDPATNSGQATIVVKGRDDVEKIIQASSGTSITRLREKISITDLKVDDSIVVIGNPNNEGQIEAKLIRVIP